jgi:hypothetical protein
MSRRIYELSAEAPDAVEDMRQLLQGLPVDTDDITVIHVNVEAELNPEDILDSLEQAQLDEYDVIEQTDVEYGPVPDFERDERPGTGTVSGGTYRGAIHEDAVMPDTKHATVLRTVNGRWLTSTEVAGQIDDLDTNAASAYLSTAFKDRGYVKRRSDAPYEYTLDQDGESALALGQDLYEQELEDEEGLE